MPDNQNTKPTSFGVVDIHDIVGDDAKDYLDRVSDALGPTAGPIVVLPLRQAQLGIREMADLLARCADAAFKRLNRTPVEPLSEVEEREVGEAVAEELRSALNQQNPYVRLRGMLEQELQAASGDPLRHAMLCRMIDDLDATRLRSSLRF